VSLKIRYKPLGIAAIADEHTPGCQMLHGADSNELMPQSRVTVTRETANWPRASTFI